LYYIGGDFEVPRLSAFHSPAFEKAREKEENMAVDQGLVDQFSAVTGSDQAR
jgi:hypothetical protein